MENNLKSRLSEFIASKGMSIRRFEQECGLPNAYVSNLRNNITSRRLDTITAKFPDLNLQWLMTGEGGMSRNESENNTDQTNAGLEKRLSDINMQMIRFVTEFVRQEAKIAESYRESIDRLQKQNAKLTDIIEKMLQDRQPAPKRKNKKTVIG